MKIVSSWVGSALLCCALQSCNVALVPDSVMYQLGAESYVEAVSEYPEITSGADYEMVQRVGRRIAEASGQDYEWEFKLLDAPRVPNAFCLPGGKIAIYSGILPITQNEDGLAVVMGHEVAHATEEHGNKRMTQGIGLNAAMIAADAAVDHWSDTSPETRGMIMGALGVASEYGVVLPYSRDHESEADLVGLRFLVRAKYDPHEAPRLWRRMATAFPERQSEWVSTHPDPENRAKALEAAIPAIVSAERQAAAQAKD